MSETETVDRIARRRARAAIALATVFVAAQFASFPDAPMNRPSILHLAAWVIWAAALLAFLSWSGGLWRGRRVQALLNDEGTRDHRQRAFALGFWVAIAAAALCYVASWYEEISAREATRLVITGAIAAALLRFGLLERRALDG